MSRVVGGGQGVTRNFAAHQAAQRHHQAAAVAQANSLSHRLMQQNLQLARSTIREVVHELSVAQPTAAELELLLDTARDAEEHDLEPEQIEKRLRETRLWHLLKVLAKNDQRIVLHLTLLLMIYQTWVMVHPPEAAPPPAPQVSVNVTVDSDEIAEKVAKQLQDEGVCLVPERQDR